MHPQFFTPNDILKPYVACYWIFDDNSMNLTHSIYPSGHLELAINISQGTLTTEINGQYIKMPEIEVLGQLTTPAKVRANSAITLLVARFQPHASRLFFSNPIAEFTDASVDLKDVFAKAARDVYSQLMEEVEIEQKIAVLEQFLVQRLKTATLQVEKQLVVERLCNEMISCRGIGKIGEMAARHGISERFIQKLFMECVGISPKTFLNIQRFKKSIKMMQLPSSSLTSVAYECGYFDQAHFIKEFKTFSGVNPSSFSGSMLHPV